MAAEAVRGDQHRCAFGVDRVGDARDPFALVGIVPRAEIDSLAVGEFLFPQALPMGRAAVVKARNRQDFMMDAGSMHGGRRTEARRVGEGGVSTGRSRWLALT